jgi:hypothetical protein
MDSGNNRAQRFAPGSTYGVTILAMSFSNPRGLRLDILGNIYIADASNDRVIMFKCGKQYFAIIFLLHRKYSSPYTVYNASTTTYTTPAAVSTTRLSSTTSKLDLILIHSFQHSIILLSISVFHSLVLIFYEKQLLMWTAETILHGNQ